MATFAASILSGDRTQLERSLQRAVLAGIDAVHLNVIAADDRPNLTLGHMVCASLRPHCPVPMAVLLGVPATEALIDRFAEAGADTVLIHPAGAERLAGLLRHIRRAGCRAGLALDPVESVDALAPVLDEVDIVHLSLAAPAPAPRRYLASQLTKLGQVRQLLDGAGRRVPLQVDGDVRVDNIRAIAEAGADAFVVGRALFGPGDTTAALAALRAELVDTADRALA